MKLWSNLFILTAVATFSVQSQKAEDYKVTKLPGLQTDDLPFDQYAGHIEVSPTTDGNLFFWMLEQVQPTNPKKLIIWLNGGPGCSSMDGLFLENGPYRVNSDMSLTINPGGWQDHATIVFLDQPVGTGFSFANGDGLMRNMTQITEEFTIFLDKFLNIFPHLKQQDLYLAGESFAGTYIPYFAHRMLELDRSKESNYNLQGVAIGNGWISPRYQYESYYDFSVKHNLLDEANLEKASQYLNTCRKQLSVNAKVNVGECEKILEAVVESSIHEEGMEKKCINYYDIRIKNEPHPSCGLTWPHELVDVTKYLRSPKLISAVHAEKKGLGWQECSGPVSKALNEDPSLSADRLLPGLLKEIKILFYSGEYDLICNSLGTEYMIGNLTWNGERGFQQAKKMKWTIGGKLAGYYTEERNLSYVLIKDGSHMVPYDKPTETLDMINRFMGVGDNKVNGVSSHIGSDAQESTSNTDQPVQENEDMESPMDVNGNNDHDEDEDENKDEQNHANNNNDESTSPAGSPSTNDGQDDTNSEFDAYTKSAGSYGALVVLMIFLVILGCWYRSKSKNKEVSNNKKSSVPFFRRLLLLSGFSIAQKKTHLRLDDQDETNELDELVIEQPTLFAAEDYSDTDEQPMLNGKTSASQRQTPKATQFSIVDEDSEGFDDFADWNDEDVKITTLNKKDDKNH